MLRNRSGAAAEIFVEGRWVASGTLEDRRYLGSDRRIHDQVFLRIGDYDESWARQLPRAGRGEERGAVAAIHVDITLDGGEQLPQVALSRPWTDAIDARVDELSFPLEHDGL